MKYVKGICLMLVVWLSFSCTDRVIYYASHPFLNKEGWDRNDTLVLDLQVTDSLSTNANVGLLIRNSSTYRYLNLATTVWHNFPDNTRWRSRDINFTLADPSGTWNGSGVGGLYESYASLGEAFTIKPGKYTFKISHQMRDGRLTGIRDVGIMIKKGF